ncbi:uncharacterized protein HKW66_Vig0240870 [Vigna angularis]|uniref:Uncharacterized protein n=1 Tax=Phaseolus angularis TaxID=3914 RepID=A0A8T0JFI4_PHAAN|nr:uncharacterized protein HKW66_Vig0240870 [Vigna angularis]
MSASDSGSEQTRRGRGITRLANVTSGRVDGQRKHVDIDPGSGQASRPNANRFRSYLGKLAKSQVSILHATWDDVPEVDKNLLWQDIQGKRLAAQERQRLNDARHLLSRGGYAKLEKKIRKSRADALGLESPDLAPAPARYELWKAARTKSDGNMTSSSAALISQRIDELVEQQTQGTFAGQGRDDILTTTIGKPEHPGRVRGVPGAIGLRDYFGHTQKTTQSMSQETLRQMDLHTRGSCSAVEPTQYSGQYELLVDGDPPRIVAVGRVLEGGQTIHGVPILPHHVRVTIDEIRDPQAQFTRPQKQAIHDTVIHEDDDMAEAEDDHLSKLMTRLPRLKKAPLELYWDLRVSGLPPLVPIYITLPDALEVIGGDRMLNISIIQLWCMYMDTIVVDQGRSSMYGFVEPQTIQPSGNTLENKQHYLQTWMDESKRDVYLVPYIDG